ncbi:MAG: alpha/beta fold hydrolase [Deltaproteobacteria bacterium]|jgi:pimeloyl-ACP methyl ester carboxylesterase|nr:alpha/beta fold hydrolase [Deltaproteobacteria bacterium]
MTIRKSLLILLWVALFSASAAAARNGQKQPLMIEEQGSFAVGGVVLETDGVFDPQKPADPKGQTYHGDHAYVFYQKPVSARKYPLIFLHGAGQFSKTWESSPDGREGFQNIFLRRNFSVYLVDQPRRGDAGRSAVASSLTPTPDEAMWFTQFRVGVWPNYFPGVQFPQDKESLNQFFRQMTPNTGPFDLEVIADALAALFAKAGPGILVTHSQGGGPGWRAAMKNPNVKAIVAYEPGSNFAFPQGQTPAPITNKYATLHPIAVPVSEFQKLTQIPIIIYYGDNIPETPSDIPAQDYWRACLEMATRWATAVNKLGGDVTLVHLPKVGFKGNTHFPFSDLNNLEIADHLSAWLTEKGLD